jgi:hypothetical protein
MSPRLFRCPNSGADVEGFLVEDALSDDPESYTPVRCLVCAQLHFVNFKTGKTVGESDEE